MLINFNCKNYLSFKEEADLSMVASSMKETYDLPSKAGFPLGKDYSILPVAAIYGANASGKSNLLGAMAFMKWFVLNSLSRNSLNERIPVMPFRFSEKTVNEPTSVEATFTIGGSTFRYGFEVNSAEVISEWLFEKEQKPRSKEKEIFYREGNELQFHSQLFRVGKVMKDQDLLKNDVLVISLAFKLNDDKALSVNIWFDNLLTIQGDHDSAYHDFSKHQILQQTSIATSMKKLIKLADTGIEDISVTAVNGKTEVVTTHSFYDADGMPDSFEKMLMNQDESAGTQKLFNISGYLFRALEAWCVLIIDEMDAKLHPNLMEKIVSMFQDPAINDKGAQLIFATHNTNILDAKLLRRDQIWIAEKDRIGASKLYSIADYNTGNGKARNTEALEQNYIQGKYGGVPFLGDLENFLDQHRNEQPTPTK